MFFGLHDLVLDPAYAGEAAIITADMNVLLDDASAPVTPQSDIEGEEDSLYSVAYDANGGTGTMADSVFNMGEAIVLQECNYSYEGFHFVGWRTSPEYTSDSVLFDPGDAVGAKDFIDGKTMVLYAIWEKNPEDPECTHILKAVKEVEPTCTKPGYEKYYYCSLCNKMFSDKNAYYEIQSPVEISPIEGGHDWGRWVVKKTPTKTKKGILVSTCKKCSEKRERSIPVLKTAKLKGSFKAKKKTIQLDTGKDRVYLFLFEIKSARKYSSGDKIEFTAKGESFDGKKILKYREADPFIKNLKKEYYWYTTGTKFKPGRYKFTIKSKKGRKYTFSYKIKQYDSYATSFKSKKTLTSINGWDWLDIRSVKPGNSLLWGKVKSSNPKAISAYYDPWSQRFYIEGHKPGKATITITLANKKKYNVKAQIYKPFLNWSSYSLYIGQSFKDKFWNYIGKVKYWSSNPRVAKVSQNGKVKAVGYGTCYIYAQGGKWKSKTKVISSYKNVRVGMTKAQVRRSYWGSPDDTASSSGGWSYWYYDDGSYIAFRYGRVKYWYDAAG